MFDPSPDADPQDENAPLLHRLKQNDLAHRSQINHADYALLQRVAFEEVETPLEYELFMAPYPKVVFIDLADYQRFIKTDAPEDTGSKAFEVVDIKVIASIVCDMLGEEHAIHEMLWSTFDEDVNSMVAAKLRLDEGESWSSTAFSNAMEVVYAVNDVILRYLVNARFPILESISIYTLEKYEKGLLVLRLRTYNEVAEAYGNS